MKKIRPSFTPEELGYLQHILWHFSDYMAGDDRRDHGFGILKRYREASDGKKHIIYRLAGRLRRLERERRFENCEKITEL